MNNKIVVWCGVLLALLSWHAMAGEARTVSSPPYRVALLELYTSEGCSSCPPADRWLSKLRDAGISERRLAPLAFHVTYWDYIGWKDRFAQKQFDLRQRETGRHNQLRTIYTPQFVLNGKDFRRYADFSHQLREINNQPAKVKLRLSLQQENRSRYRVMLQADTAHSTAKAVELYLAVLEHELVSNVEAGENDGETLHHDYVVRMLKGPVRVRRDDAEGEISVKLDIPDDWRQSNMQLTGFAQNPRNGEVLQAVTLSLLER